MSRFSVLGGEKVFEVDFWDGGYPKRGAGYYESFNPGVGDVVMWVIFDVEKVLSVTAIFLEYGIRCCLVVEKCSKMLKSRKTTRILVKPQDS